MVSKPWLKCPLSGETDPLNLLRIKLIPELDDNADELKVACTEWFWGLKRGGLQYSGGKINCAVPFWERSPSAVENPGLHIDFVGTAQLILPPLYHLANAHNSLYFRRDIAHLYASFQFILAPTFKTFLDILDFNQRAGILSRTDDDISPRRPLTALTPPSGFYRYVFIPMTDAARQLQKELNLPPQTEEDLNGGLDPRSKRPLHEGTETFTVVECFAHPYCVSTLAEHAFNYYDDWATRVTAQWSLCTLRIVELWHHRKARDVPRWFIDSPGMDEDDITVTSTEGAGYTISRRSQDGNGRPRTVYEGQEALEAKVSAWAEGVDPNTKPEEQPPVLRESIPVRRSVRIAQRANPYKRPEQTYYRPTSPIRKAPWPCPEHEDPYRSPPAWAMRNGQYPTRGFSSNDWAYFCYRVSLPAPRKL